MATARSLRCFGAVNSALTTHHSLFIMRRRKAAAFTLTEFAVAIVAATVLMLVAWAAWEMSWRQTWATLARSETARNTVAVLRSITHEVMRAETIEVPDPDHNKVDSIQLHVPVAGGTVRRAFRIEGDALILDLKDEVAAPFTAFEGLSELTFTVLDPPMNSVVEISCSCTEYGQAIVMRTVAKKRN